MEKTNSHNNLITREPFGGKFRKKHSARALYDLNEKIMGSVSGKRIFDLNGEPVANRKRRYKCKIDDGSKVKITEYTAENQNFRLIDDRLYRTSDGDEELIGKITVTKRNPSHIILLSALALFLVGIIALIYFINLPLDDRPEIFIRDVDGDLSGRGTIAVFDEKIKPGDSGEYYFIITNPYNVDIEYSFGIEKVYDGAEIDYFPLEFRIKMNNVLLETSEWRTVEELRFDELNIMPTSEQSFTLEWRWAFEKGSDYNDTLLGADGGKISLVLQLTAQQGGNSL